MHTNNIISYGFHPIRYNTYLVEKQFQFYSRYFAQSVLASTIHRTGGKYAKHYTIKHLYSKGK